MTKMTQMERIEHHKRVEKWSKESLQKLLMGNDWIKSGKYTPVENYKKMLVGLNWNICH